MPSLPSSNTWQSIPSTLPPPNRPAACTFAHEAHHCQKQPRSFLEDCLLRLLAWHSCIFLLVHRWNMRHLCILNATNECWNMGKVPVGLPHRPEWVRSFEITGRTKSHGGTRGTNGGWLCFIWNLWEIYGKSTEIKDINQVKWNMLSDQHLVAPSPGLLWNFTKTNDVAVYRALMGEWHGEFKPCPEWIIWPMCRKKNGAWLKHWCCTSSCGLRHRHMIWYLEKKHMKWIWNGASKHHSGTEDTNTKKRRQEVWETANEHRYRCYFLNVQNMEPL